jgi:hypothetical protein
MSTASRPFDKLPGPVKRLILAVGAGVAFVAISASLNPDSSLARAREEASLALNQPSAISQAQGSSLAVLGGKPTATNASAPAARSGDAARLAIAAPVATNLALLGRMIGGPYNIWVYSGQSGPVYTVTSARGQILAVEKSVDELTSLIPDLGLENLRLETQVMMVDPDSIR